MPELRRVCPILNGEAAVAAGAAVAERASEERATSDGPAARVAGDSADDDDDEANERAAERRDDWANWARELPTRANIDPPSPYDRRRRTREVASEKAGAENRNRGDFNGKPCATSDNVGLSHTQAIQSGSPTLTCKHLFATI